MLKQIRTDEIGIDTCVDPSTYLYNNIIATVVCPWPIFREIFCEIYGGRVNIEIARNIRSRSAKFGIQNLQSKSQCRAVPATQERC